MGVIDAMTEAVKLFADTAADIVKPRGTLVIVSPQVPDIYPTNASLATWKAVRSAVDQSLIPVVVFENPSARNKRNQGHVLDSIVKMCSRPEGGARVVIRQPHESVTQAADRARVGLKLPVVGVVVGYPPAHRSFDHPGSFPQSLRQHFMTDAVRRPDMAVVACYSDAQLYREERVVVNNGFNESVQRQFDLDASDLGHYSTVTAPKPALVQDLKDKVMARIDPVFAGAYELFDESGDLNIVVDQIPPARFFSHGMSNEVRASFASNLADMLGIDSTVKVTERGIEHVMEHSFQHDYSSPSAPGSIVQPGDTQDSFTLGT